MKSTKILVIAMASLALAACSDDEIVKSTSQSDPNVISYSCVTSNATRAASLYNSSSKMPNFYVWARTYDADAAAVDGNPAPSSTYFAGDEIQVTSTDGTKTNSIATDITATRYWPTDALDFYAYASNNDYSFPEGATYDDEVSHIETEFKPGTKANHDATLTIKNVSLDNDAAYQEDMLYAATFEQKKKTDNGSTNLVEMNFRHAFAQLVFQFQNVNAGLQVKVDEIRLVNIYTKGDVTFKNYTDNNYNYSLSDTYENTTKIEDNGTSICTWDNKTVLNYYAKDESFPNDAPGYYREWTNEDGDHLSRYNWAYEKISTSSAITLNAGESPTMLYAVNPSSTTYTNNVKTLVDQRAAIEEVLKIASMTEPTDEVTEEKIAAAQAKFAESGDYANVTYVKSDYTIDEEAYEKEMEKAKHKDAEADMTNAITNKTTSNAAKNAMYVIPQDIMPATIPATTEGKKRLLKDIKGMYFLIKCSIRNVADASLGAQDSDNVYLHGIADKTAFVLVPLRDTSYENGDEAYATTDPKTAWLTEWEPGKKYVYTIIFGAPGSNGGIPTVPETNEDPDDPDNNTPIDDNPTLTVINYNVQAFTIDCWADGKDTNVNVTVDDSELKSSSN